MGAHLGLGTWGLVFIRRAGGCPRWRLPSGDRWGVVHQLQRMGLPVNVKWPNDLVVAGQKLGGILVESRSSDPQFAVVGIGLNWANPVPPGATRAVEFPSRVVDLPHLAALVVQGIWQGRSRWRGDRGGC
ncbi:MAG: hypothetical protein HC918_14185 [Oscillatoriales cyanobacterium SM2_1_8]|nr:hypothetical protein [Oscillatoriales cyanobacterium SM2_1_8]